MCLDFIFSVYMQKYVQKNKNKNDGENVLKWVKNIILGFQKCGRGVLEGTGGVVRFTVE